MASKINQKLSQRPVEDDTVLDVLNREVIPVVEKLRLAQNDLIDEVDAIPTVPPSTASYITLAATSDLPNERVLTAGTGIQIADGGPGNPVTVTSISAVGEILRHDTAFSPVGLWQFNQSLVDGSGNGFTLTVDAGTESYVLMEQRLWGIRLDNCRLTHAFDPLLHQLGDMTIGMFLMWETQPGGYTIITFSGGESDASSTLNYNYTIALSPNGIVSPITDRVPSWFSEHGVGVNDIYTVATATGKPLLLPPPGVLFHLMVTRTSNVIQFYVDGVPFGPASGVLTATDDGSASMLWFGGIAGTGPARLQTGTVCSSAVIIPSALTADQVKAYYNRTLGPFKGPAA